MSEVGGITELQLLQADVGVLKKQLEGIQEAEHVSVASGRIASSISKGEDKDGFLVKEGGVSEQSQFHTTGPSAEEGCCVVL